MNVNVRPLRRRTRQEQMIKVARQLPGGIRSSLDGIHPPKAVKSGATAVLAATAASAAISALRRRIETPRSDR